MIRNKALRLVLFNVALIGMDFVAAVIWYLTLTGALYFLQPLNMSLTTFLTVVFLSIILRLFLASIRRGVSSRLLIRETWIPNAVYVIEAFVSVYLFFCLCEGHVNLYFDPVICTFSVIGAFFYGAISSGASLITWAIQCKVQKRRAAKQVVLLEE